MRVTPRTWAIAAGGTLLLLGGSIYAWHTWIATASPTQDWPSYAPGAGLRYCSRLGSLARERSMQHTVVASILAVLGSCLFILGNVVEPAPPDAQRWRRNRGAVLLH